MAEFRSEHSAVVASIASKNAELERANLLYETLKTTHGELKHKHDELQQSHAESMRQLEKWRNLDSRDTSELENLRQQKINLEITVKALEGQLEEAKKNGAKYSDAKVEKWKKSVEEYQVCQVLH